MSDDPRPEDLSAEGEGDSLGEAKWAAMKELEPRFPGITAESVDFEVIDEPEGDGVARVRAQVDEDAWRAAAEVIPEEPGERVRAIVGRVVHALGLRATVDIEETEEEIRATVNGDELGLLIGKHGSTIDAVQHLAFRAAYRGREERKQVTVDAAGYRERRETALHRMADRAAAEALRYDRGGRARADARARAQDRPHVPERARRRGDALRGRRAGSAAGDQPGAVVPRALSVSRETLAALPALRAVGRVRRADPAAARGARRRTRSAHDGQLAGAGARRARGRQPERARGGGA